MGARKFAKFTRRHAWLAFKIDSPQRTLDPDVDWESLVEPAREQQRAVGDFLPDAGQLDQLFQRLLIFHRRQRIQIEFATVDHSRRRQQVLGAKTQFAVPKLLMRRAGNRRNGRKRVMSVTERLTVASRQQVNDLPNLHDLL